MTKQHSFDEIDKAELAKKYQSGMTTYELADEYGVVDTTIGSWIRKIDGVETRGKSSGTPDTSFDEIDKGELAQKYEDGMTTYELADEYGVVDTTIGNWIDKIDGVETRGVSSNTPDTSFDEIDKTELAQKYGEGMSTYALGDEYGVNPTTIGNWIDKIDGVETRSHSSREDSDYYSGFLPSVREEIFERDNYTCQDCGQVGGELNAHHTKRRETHPDLAQEPSNGVTLCIPCHHQRHVDAGEEKAANGVKGLASQKGIEL